MIITTSIFYGFLIYFLTDFVYGNELIVKIEYINNNTFILYYNLTTNYSYYLTFRLFEHEQIKFGLFSNKIQENTIEIFNQYNNSSIIKSVYLFITCFYFIRRLNDIDIQCKDIRLLISDHNKTSLPSYKPLFVPMMYALSILMLLPVIIQHRRQKQAQLIERHKQLRRLSLTISPDNPNILSDIILSLPSTKTILDDNLTFPIQTHQIFIDQYEEEEEKNNDEYHITADDCIAHLLNNTPWSSTSIENNSTDRFKDQRIPMIKKFCRNEQKSNSYLFRSNPAFIESDV